MQRSLSEFTSLALPWFTCVCEAQAEWGWFQKGSRQASALATDRIGVFLTLEKGIRESGCGDKWERDLKNPGACLA